MDQSISTRDNSHLDTEQRSESETNQSECFIHLPRPFADMTILVTGGSGRTSSAVAKRLHAANIPFLVLSRSGTAPAPFDACRFDFYDESTFETPFAKASDIDAIYVVVPTIVSDTVDQPVNAFIDFARAKGVKRFVVLTASNYDPPTRIAGAVHQHLMDVGDVEYAVMRPTWYMGTKKTLFHLCSV